MVKNSRLSPDLECRMCVCVGGVWNCLRTSNLCSPRIPFPPPPELELLVEKLDKIGLVCGDVHCVPEGYRIFLKVTFFRLEHLN